MLTNNYQAIMVNILTNQLQQWGKCTTGVGSIMISSGLLSSNSLTIVLGTGDTPAKQTDYKLESPIDKSGYNCIITKELTNDYAKENSTTKILGTITNTGDDALIVKEIGLYSDVNSSTTVMLAREVLEKPVTLEPRKTISYEFQLF